ncbi:unnamed protein product, partial [Choristocarpus tenellus]
VFAFDKDLRRHALLHRRVEEGGGKGVVKVCLQDFLETNVSDPRYAEVRSILLDPSCSGSGIVTSPERIHDQDTTVAVEGGEGGGVCKKGESNEAQDRLKRLAIFQLSALKKAMSFPQVQRVCYSTCSLHRTENEAVVMDALSQQPEFTGEGGDPSVRPFRLVPCLPKWHRRGVSGNGVSDDQAQCMVRADPFEDQTNGFFVALLSR